MQTVLQMEPSMKLSTDFYKRMQTNQTNLLEIILGPYIAHSQPKVVREVVSLTPNTVEWCSQKREHRDSTLTCRNKVGINLLKIGES